MEEFHGYGGENKREDSANILSRFFGLRETLYAWCDVYGQETGPLSLDEVATLLIADSGAREAARQYIGRGGSAWLRDPERADSVREKLAWAIVEKLSSN